MGQEPSAQEQGHEAAQLKFCQKVTFDDTIPNHKQQPQATSDNATISSSAITATFNTTELLEQILSYLPAPQLLTSKATSRIFRNAIEASPILRRKTSTFLRLGDVDEENDLSQTDAGGEVVFPNKALEPLAFFYPGNGERRLFVRIEVGDPEGLLGRVGKLNGGFGGVGNGAGFGGLVVVDQALSDVKAGWHCTCFEEGRGEVRVACPTGIVTFGNVLGAMEREHRGKSSGGCGSLRKFWVDGLWRRSGEMREFGR